jgi:hypothetical protein
MTRGWPTQVCNFGARDLANFCAAGGRPISNQFHYNLLWRSIEPEVCTRLVQGDTVIIPHCHRLPSAVIS